MDFVNASGDTVDLDALFEALGGGYTGGTDLADGNARADDVTINGNVLTIDGLADFSITFAGTSDAFVNDASFTAAELAALGIDVGT